MSDGPGPPVAAWQRHSKHESRKSRDSSRKSHGGSGDSQRNSLSINNGLRTYREQAGSKMAAIAVVAREQVAAHQAELSELLRYVAFLILFVLVVFLRAPQDLPSFWNQALRARSNRVLFFYFFILFLHFSTP